jgi:pre-60S factor REI1
MAALCNSCNLRLESDEDKGSHYGTELHKLNAKRRAADLPPITPQGYARLKDAQEAQQRAAEEADAEVLYICEACHKTFGSEGQFSTHNASKKHRDEVRTLLAERKAARAAEKERAAAGLPPLAILPPPSTPGGEAEVVIGATNCVFCWCQCDSVEANLAHMRSAHSFAIPDAPACTEPEALVEYLHSRVLDAHVCLMCTNGKEFESPDAARQHMMDKCHCAMRYEEEADFEEYERFYDYTGVEDVDGEGLALPEAQELRRLGMSGGALPLAGGGVARHKAMLRYYKQAQRLEDDSRRLTSVDAAMTRLAIENMAAAAGRGSGAQGNLPLTSRVNTAAGVRGNLTVAASQRRAEHRAQHAALGVGMTSNLIIRRYWRIQADNTGH